MWKTSARFIAHASVLSAVLVATATAGQAARLENKVAVFAALDKVTANISRLEVGLDDLQVFGALTIVPRVCYSRPPTEPPKTTAFVEVYETKLDGSRKKIFSGWMFAESPGLNAVEHPVFDVWLTGCGANSGRTAQVNQRSAQAASEGIALPVRKTRPRLQRRPTRRKRRRR